MLLRILINWLSLFSHLQLQSLCCLILWQLYLTHILFVYQVCNRKFKKHADLDRHLFVHNLGDTSNVFRCELCDYVSSRKSYLQKHCRKHRIIFCCAECNNMFPSLKRLKMHTCAQVRGERLKVESCGRSFYRLVIVLLLLCIYENLWFDVNYIYVFALHW